MIAVQRILHYPMDDLQTRHVESSVLQVKRIVRTEECREMKDFAIGQRYGNLERQVG